MLITDLMHKSKLMYNYQFQLLTRTFLQKDSVLNLNYHKVKTQNLIVIIPKVT